MGSIDETARDNAHPRARIGRFLSGLPSQVAACSFLDPYELEVREIQFLAWPRKLVDLPSDAPDDATVTCPGPPFAWILTPNHWIGSMHCGSAGREGSLRNITSLTAFSLSPATWWGINQSPFR